MGWKEKAFELYFKEHLRIGEIAEKVGKSRQSVSAFLKSTDLFESERQYRKNQSKKRRKKQKADWDRKKRSPLSVDYEDNVIVAENIKREHRTAVSELSRERYY